MTVRFWMLVLSAACLVAALVPAVFFRLQPRLEPWLPLRGRWLGPFLWGSAGLSFLVFLSAAAVRDVWQ